MVSHGHVRVLRVTCEGDEHSSSQSGSLAGRIRILVLRRPLKRSSFDGCISFLVALPLPLLLLLRLLAIFDKKVESNVTAMIDETLRPASIEK